MLKLQKKLVSWTKRARLTCNILQHTRYRLPDHLGRNHNNEKLSSPGVWYLEKWTLEKLWLEAVNLPGYFYEMYWLSVSLLAQNRILSRSFQQELPPLVYVEHCPEDATFGSDCQGDSSAFAGLQVLSSSSCYLSYNPVLLLPFAQETKNNFTLNDSFWNMKICNATLTSDKLNNYTLWT